MKKNISIPVVLGVIVSLLLFWALAKHSYGYYTFLRWATCGVASYFAYLTYEVKPKWWFFIFIFIALLFNPIIPVYLDEDIWGVIDIIAGIYFIAAIRKLRTNRSKISE
jgi:hypothetical protein